MKLKRLKDLIFMDYLIMIMKVSGLMMKLAKKFIYNNF